MKLERVTITGADDRTDPKELVRLSQQYPFVEWGILVSSTHDGTPRFPSRSWNRAFVDAIYGKGKVSTHICGIWSRELLAGKLDWNKLPECLWISDRVQINRNSSTSPSAHLLDKLAELSLKEFIFQWDGSDPYLIYTCARWGLKVSALFDTSGGAGLLPTEWPAPLQFLSCGYAGGLGPENVRVELEKISRVCQESFWIDMEQRVRMEDDSELDLEKVESVLKQAEIVVDQK